MIWPVSLHRLYKEIPNGLSVLRGVASLFIAYFLFRPSPSDHFIAFWIFFVAAITDFMDGWLARKLSLVSDTGKILDPTVDKILVLVPLAVFSMLGLFSVWWIVLIFAREIAVTFCRMGLLRSGLAVGAEKLGKWKLVVQVCAVGVAFLYFISSYTPGWMPHRALLQTMVLVWLFLANILTLISGLSFFSSNRTVLSDPQFAKFVLAAGVGFLPFAPGTWGTLAGLCLVPLLSFNGIFYAGVLLALILLGRWQSRKLDFTKEKDPSFIVLDEVCGILLTFFLIPLSWASAAAGFLLFRIFDVIKPFPLRRLEKVPGYWGVMLDDLGAGIYCWLILFFLFRGSI